MKHIVGVADMKVVSQPGDIIVTHALGSCLGIAVHDPVIGVGGLLHVMLPMSKISPEKALANPSMFVDTGVPALFRAIYDAGGEKRRLKVTVAGGANIQNHGEDKFAIGQRNYTVFKKILWKNGVLIDAEDVAGTIARTMYLEIGSGKVWLSIQGKQVSLMV